MFVPKFAIPVVASLRYFLSGPFWDWEGFNRYGMHRRARHSIYAMLGILFSFLSMRLEPLVIGLTAHAVFDPEGRFSTTIDRNLGKIAGVFFAVPLLRMLDVPHCFPIGVVAGIVIGHWFDTVRGIIDSGQAFGSLEYLSNRRQRIFDRCAMSMLAALTKADGRITEVEIRTIEDFLSSELNYNEAQREFAIQAFRRSREGKSAFADYAREFLENFRHDLGIVDAMLDFLIRVAVSDGEFSSGERKHIETAAWQFGVSDDRLERLLASYGVSAKKTSSRQRTESNDQRHPPPRQDSPDSDYTTLGVSPSASQAEIKRAYRKLVKQYHPDTLVGRGLPAKMLTEARKRFEAVQRAYDNLSSRS